MSKTNKSIFEKDIFNLPKRRNGVELPIFLKSQFEEFFNHLNKFNGEIRDKLKIKLPLIKRQSEFIVDAVDLYYKGFPALAYEKIQNTLDELESNKILPVSKIPNSEAYKNLYRIRLSDNKALQKKDLFHIPFESREKVATQRYSIPGLPCLYLGDSIFVCWEELNRPSFDNIHATRMDLSQSNFKLLYFNVSVDEIRKRCFTRQNADGKFPNLISSFLSYWPLFTACSMVVDKPTEIFKPEYLIPQLVLQWVVSTQKMDGVQYKSNRMSLSNHNLGTFTNVVIPIKKISSRGYCSELVKKIKVANPISWQLLDISTFNPSKLSESNGDIQISELRKAMYIELIPNEKTYYLNTKFGLLEEKLKTMVVDYIQ